MKPKACLVNCMRKWYTSTAAAFLSQDEGVKEAGEGRKEDTHDHMPLHQLRELQRFKEKYQNVSQDVPGRTGLWNIKNADTIDYCICSGPSLYQNHNSNFLNT